MSRTQKAIAHQYAVALDRRINGGGEKSYTCYLYARGRDHILKKCGEECFEVCIAAKNGDHGETVGELNDVIYNLVVLLCHCGIGLDPVMADIGRRCQSDSLDVEELIRVIALRRDANDEGSYTAYLFREGLDKILKKVGEGCTQLIIAAKDGDDLRVIEFAGDLLYHLLAMMVCIDLPISALADELEKRSGKTGNLKSTHQSDHTT